MKFSSAYLLSASVLLSQLVAFPILDSLQHPLGSLFEATEKPYIETNQLQELITKKNLESKANDLYKSAEASLDAFGHPTRVIGSPGHHATISYILSKLKELEEFYEVSTQDFEALDGKVFDYSLLIDGEQPKSAAPMSMTPATKNKNPVNGPLVLVSGEGCDSQDYPLNVTGSIALVRRGKCSFGDKSILAGKLGALGVLIYNNEPGSISGTLGTPTDDSIATMRLSQEEGDVYIARLLKGEELPVTMYIDAEINKIKTTNIIAQSKQGDQENVVMLGGHSDSVSDGPGINDDGSGSLSILEVAQQLTNFQLNNSVRFAWWSAEEEGLLGSDYYVSQLSLEENFKIRLFMDYDMMASPNYAYQVYDANNVDNPKGSEELKNLYIDWYTAQGLNHTLIPFDGRSDYVAFIDNEIPGGGIAAGAEGVKTGSELDSFGGSKGEWYDHCYHQLCDDLSNVNYEAWITNTKLIAHSVATYSRSMENFPERELSASTTDLKKSRFKFHGSELII